MGTESSDYFCLQVVKLMPAWDSSVSLHCMVDTVYAHCHACMFDSNFTSVNLVLKFIKLSVSVLLGLYFTTI